MKRAGSAFPILTQLPTPAVDPSGYVDVFWTTQQSNGVGLAVQSWSIPPGFYMWPHVIGVTSPVGLSALGPYAGVQHGIELELAGQLASKNVTPFSMKVAQGNTSLFDTWLPPSAPGWTQLVADWAIVQPLLAAQYPGKIIRHHLIPFGGEYEALLVTSDPRVSSYGANLATLVAGWRTLVSSPTAGVHIPLAHNHFPASSWPSDSLIQTQMVNAVAAISNCYGYATDSWPTNNVDRVHYDPYWLAARAIAAGILSTI